MSSPQPSAADELKQAAEQAAKTVDSGISTVAHSLGSGIAAAQGLACDTYKVALGYLDHAQVRVCAMLSSCSTHGVARCVRTWRGHAPRSCASQEYVQQGVDAVKQAEDATVAGLKGRWVCSDQRHISKSRPCTAVGHLRRGCCLHRQQSLHRLPSPGHCWPPGPPRCAYTAT